MIRILTHPPARRAILVGLGAAALAGASTGCSRAGDDGVAATEQEAVPVMVRAVGRVGRASAFALSGDVEGFRTANIGFLVPGVVAAVGPSEGQAVQQGQVLASLDTTEYALNVELAAAQLERAEDEFERARQMFAERGIPENDFHKARTGVRMARVGVAMARKKLADTRIVAPMSGIVSRRGVEPGEQAGPGFPVLTLVQTNPILVRIGVPESEIGRVAVGQTVRIVVPSLNGRAVTGRLKVVGISADPAARTYTAKAEVANPGGLLRPGMIAEVRIESSERVDALTVPAEAVVRTADGTMQVFVYNAADKRVYARKVDVGVAYGQEVEIRRGLTADDVVVIGGQHRVREGSPVIVRDDAVPSDTAGTAPVP